MQNLNRHIAPVLIAILVVLFTSIPSEARQLSDEEIKLLDWQIERLDTGIYWKQYLGDDLFDSKQSINLVEIYLDSTDAELQISYEQNGHVKTSDFAKNVNALVAINGSFFNTETGGTVTFLKVQDSVIVDGASGRNLYTENGGIAWNNSNSPKIIPRPENGWAISDLENVIASGPLLVLDKTIRSFNNDPFNQNRHPRTAVATTTDNRLFLLTVDGRSFQSYGMTIPELAEFLLSAGAADALNLDGGGSTTMWIQDKTETGVVNYPSDNLEFDHNGERRVSSALLLILNR